MPFEFRNRWFSRPRRFIDLTLSRPPEPGETALVIRNLALYPDDARPPRLFFWRPTSADVRIYFKQPSSPFDESTLNALKDVVLQVSEVVRLRRNRDGKDSPA